MSREQLESIAKDLDIKVTKKTSSETIAFEILDAEARAEAATPVAKPKKRQTKKPAEPAKEPSKESAPKDQEPKKRGRSGNAQEARPQGIS